MNALMRGMTVAQIARKLGGRDDMAYKRHHSRITRLARKDAIFRARMQEALAGESLLGSPSVIQAAIRRAGRGRMDAVRYVMSHAGMYNEKVSHEHSGDIAVTVKIARPDRVEDRTHRMDLEEGIIDAEVVEETD